MDSQCPVQNKGESKGSSCCLLAYQRASWPLGSLGLTITWALLGSSHHAPYPKLQLRDFPSPSFTFLQNPATQSWHPLLCLPYLHCIKYSSQMNSHLPLCPGPAELQPPKGNYQETFTGTAVGPWTSSPGKEFLKHSAQHIAWPISYDVGCLQLAKLQWVRNKQTNRSCY